MDDLDRQLRQLLDQEAQPTSKASTKSPLAALIPDGMFELDENGLPVDPANMIIFDRILQHQLLERTAKDREVQRDLLDRASRSRAEAATERAEIERHWDRWEEVSGRIHGAKTGVPSQPTWQHPTWQPPAVHFHLNLQQPQQYYQPAPAPWQPVGQLYTEPAGPPNDAQFMRRIIIGVATCALLTLAMIWALAAGMQARAEQHIQQDQHYSTSTTVAP